jgi:DNA ligase-4
MKAANCELEDLTKHMGQEEFIIETKLDGERLLVHRKDDQWKLYSRNSTDQTLQYGETGGLLNVIKGQLDPRISE